MLLRSSTCRIATSNVLEYWSCNKLPSYLIGRLVQFVSEVSFPRQNLTNSAANLVNTADNGP